MSGKEMVQYCYNPITKEIVEGQIPPSKDFIPIIGYFDKKSVLSELIEIFDEIVAR